MPYRAVLDGDGADDDTLAEAGIQHAAALVACVDDDATNVYVVLTAKGLRPDLHVVARASSESAAGKLRRAGADEVISPYTIAGERIAAVLTERAAQTPTRSRRRTGDHAVARVPTLGLYDCLDLLYPTQRWLPKTVLYPLSYAPGGVRPTLPPQADRHRRLTNVRIAITGRPM